MKICSSFSVGVARRRHRPYVNPGKFNSQPSAADAGLLYCDRSLGKLEILLSRRSLSARKPLFPTRC
ncbi:MAG: hypothetical protein V7K14_06420 [Nostoc sp.]|uniref:hypothetical protein n=1 Tax=Nostoc sp. TaxID=1180 RepID=UPI002FF76491